MNKPVTLKSAGIRIVQVPIYVTFIPRRTGVFQANGGQMVGGYLGAIGSDIRRPGGLAVECSSIGRLRKLIRVGIPILRQMSQVVIERTVLLQHEDDVIDGILQ